MNALTKKPSTPPPAEEANWPVLRLISDEALERIMPMHLIVSSSGHIVSVGPTLRKICADAPLDGCRFLEVFEVARPRETVSMAALMRASQGKLRLTFRNGPNTQLQGLIVSIGDNGDALINLSFGYAVVDAVNHWSLTCGDFAFTDLTLEMLYLIEAKSAAQVEQKKLNQKLNGARLKAERQALTDGLTGLSNRRALDMALQQLIQDQALFALVQIDLDYFKAVNDRLGHAAGDAVLEHVARVLKSETRSSDVVARVGGDEFTVIFHRLVDADKLMDVADRIIKRLEKAIPYNEDWCEISGSIGIAVSTHYDHATPEEMLHHADVALYASKYKGRACATLYREGLEQFVEEQASLNPSCR